MTYKEAREYCKNHRRGDNNDELCNDEFPGIEMIAFHHRTPNNDPDNIVLYDTRGQEKAVTYSMKRSNAWRLKTIQERKDQGRKI